MIAISPKKSPCASSARTICFLIFVGDGDAHPATLDQIHRVAGIARRETESCRLQSSRVRSRSRSSGAAVIVKRSEERHGANRIKRHFLGGWC